ncbi:MAG: thiol-disulfide oxidoreductase DCC family protein [Actinomycetes bacterium]
MAGLPTLVYDGDCGFCTACARFLDVRVRPRARLVAWQDADLAALRLTAQQCRESVQWVPAGGGPLRLGARAVAEALGAGRAPWSWAGRAMQLPGLLHLAEPVYRLVSAHRSRLPGGTPACALPPGRRPGSGTGR